MLLICAGMYRACSTWQYDVVADLLERHQPTRRLGYLTGDQAAALDPSLDLGDTPFLVLKSHEGHRHFTRLVNTGRARVIYAYRDVRDVVYSLIHKRAIDFPTLLRRGMVHQILANDRYWTAQPGTLIQRYEAIMADPVAAVRQLARFLDLPATDAEIQQVVQQHSLAANRRRTEALSRQLQARGVDLTDRSNAQHYDPHTLLHWNHLRDGRAGTWRELAAPDERLVMHRLLGPWLADHGYAPDPLLAHPPADSRARPPVATPGLRWAEARGYLACSLRRLSSRYPHAAGLARRLLRLPDPSQVEARPALDLSRPRSSTAHGPARPPHFATNPASQPDWSESA